ncbi:MAG: two-component system OmpR family response regulator [Alphaproteobacteria bacterium]|jgi:two-component system OmpR family response regulator
MVSLKKILYIEDDPSIAEVTTMTFEMIGGFEVKHLFSGQEGLDEFDKYKPQLILIDMIMPDMDGLETIKKLRQFPTGQDVPVIFITAKAQMHEQQDYIESGAVGVIIKPFDPVQLCVRVQQLWEESNG